MKIAQISPLGKTTPPKGYGGTQRDVYLISNELVSMGHEVTLFAEKGSYSKAKVLHYKKLTDILYKVREYDIIHSHIANPKWIITLSLLHPNFITTYHGWISSFRDEFSKLIVPRIVQSNFIVLNDSIVQRLKKIGLKNVWRIYNPIEFGTFRQNKKDYLLYLGRIEKKKGIHKMVELSNLTGKKLILAGVIMDQEYFHSLMKNANEEVKFVGEVWGEKKDRLIGEARCILSMSEDEPFGLTIPEANSRGTPALALAKGSMPELIIDGYNGYLFKTMEEAKTLVQRIEEINPDDCLCSAERFIPENIARQHIELYEKIKNS